MNAHHAATARATPAAVSAELLDEGRRLLAEQRQAMIDGDAELLADRNARLAQWLGRMPRGAAVPAETLAALRSAAQLNAQTAARAATRSQQGLQALLPSETFTYDAAGLGRAGSAGARRTLA
ncbi:MAG: hypothetical protein AB7L76_07165 [Burkholderiaceae bacterium]